jgi:tetratricopeptide (TPR) repeat protein
MAAALLLPSLVLAGPVEEAKALMDGGQYAAALEKLDAHLRRNAQDAEGRFLRGLALVQLDRSADAIRSFADLTRDYPQLPEPYNNLAVLYAQEGDYEKARDALEAALATHPSYATAHENLGDIYAALAGAAYNRALLLDQANQGVRNKLSLISQLDSGALVPAAPVVPAAAALPETAPGAAEAAPTATPAPAAAPAVAPDTAAIESAIRAWARAWSTQDLSAYFFAYSQDFVPEGGLTRAAWETQRRDRISRPGRIAVNVSDIRTEPTAQGIRASFVQDYESDNFSDTVTKTLDLVREDGNWKIVREFTR